MTESEANWLLKKQPFLPVFEPETTVFALFFKKFPQISPILFLQTNILNQPSARYSAKGCALFIYFPTSSLIRTEPFDHTRLFEFGDIFSYAVLTHAKLFRQLCRRDNRPCKGLRLRPLPARSDMRARAARLPPGQKPFWL